MQNEIPLPEEVLDLSLKLINAQDNLRKAKLEVEEATDVLSEKMRSIGVMSIKHAGHILKLREAKIPKDKITIKLN